MVERANFHKMTRKSEESFKEFSLRVHQQAAKCAFDNQLEEQLRDRLVAGINNEEMERKLLGIPDLQYAQTKQLIFEFDKINNAVSCSSPQVLRVYRKSSKVTVNQQNKARSTHSSGRNHSNATSKPSGTCFSCGGNHYRNQCKFRNSTCFNCQKIGHIAKVCKQEQKTSTRHRNIAKLTNEIQNSEESEKEYDCLHLTSGDKHIKKELVLMNNIKCNFIVDTGSPVSLMNYDFFIEKFPGVAVHNYTGIVTGVTGHKVEIKGKINLKLNSGQNNLNFLLVPQPLFVLGLDNLKLLKIDLSTCLNTSNSSIPGHLEIKIAQCGTNSGGMRISPVELEYSGDPVFCKSRQISYGLRDAVESGLNELVKNKILSPVKSSCWATPIVTPLKSNGTPRICGDYRITVNPRLLQRASTLPEPEDIFAQFHGSKYFSRIDLKDAFLQIPLHENSKELTTINTPFGLYQYNYLPFGLTTSPSIFQSIIDNSINDLSCTVAYQDDIIVFSATKDQHVAQLDKVIDRLLSYNIKINITKSVFCVNSLTYLGYKVSADGIKPDESKYKSITEAPIPSCHKELRTFLGCIQYYSRFISNFAKVAEPLYELLNLENFSWTNNHESARQSLLAAITSSPTLSSYRFDAPADIICDASQHAIGAVLEQQGKPVMFISRRLNACEKGYSQTQKEALAVIWSVRRLHKYIFGRRFNIVSDHEALKFIFHPTKSLHRNTAAMVQRWAIELSAYDYTFEFKPGTKIPQADFLSRFSSLQEEENTVHYLQPLPINREQLIDCTHKELGGLIYSLRNGWSTNSKKKFNHYFRYRENLSVLPDNVIMHCDQVCIPSTLRSIILKHLHCMHTGRDRMLSTARQVYWWPNMNNDISNYVKDCLRCGVKPRTHPTRSSWPLSYEPLQRLHLDYCGPILGKYYALVVIDTYSRYPEIFFTTKADGQFTKEAIRKYMSRFGIPQTIVTDNGRHFTAEVVQNYFKSLGIINLFSPPRHPQSNGIAENFIRTFKSTLQACTVSNYCELNDVTDNFLLQYRCTPHTTTGMQPAELFLGRKPRTSLQIRNSTVAFKKGNDQILTKGIIIKTVGNNIFLILDTSDHSVHKRHRDQVTFFTHDYTYPPFKNLESTATSTVSSQSSSVQRDATTNSDDESLSRGQNAENPTSQAPTLRRSTRTRRRPIYLNDYVCEEE